MKKLLIIFAIASIIATNHISLGETPVFSDGVSLSTGSGGNLTNITPLVTGSLTATGAVSFPISSTTVTTTLDNTHQTVLADATANSIDYILPLANSASGRVYDIYFDLGTNTVRVLTSGSDLIDRETNALTIVIKESFPFQSDGVTNWIIK